MDVEHKNKLIIGVVIAAVVIRWRSSARWYYISQQDDKANFELTKAVRTLETQIRPAGSPETPNLPRSRRPQERAAAAKKQLQAMSISTHTPTRPISPATCWAQRD